MGKIVAIVQARMGSSRLPGKVMMPLHGTPVLGHVLKRLAAASSVDELCLATTDNPSDDPIVDFADSIDVTCVRGSEENVLLRFMDAARATDADVIVRITGDCPCLDPLVIDRVVAEHVESKADYTSNLHPERSYPHGLDTEVVNRGVLESANDEASERWEREHVMPFVWTRPERFTLHNVVASSEEYMPELRITLDTPEDHLVLKAVFDLLGDSFSCKDLVELARKYPWITEINAQIHHKAGTKDSNVPRQINAELVETFEWAFKQDLYGAAETVLKALEKHTASSIKEYPLRSDLRRRFDSRRV